jgi:hypothetical protein
MIAFVPGASGPPGRGAPSPRPLPERKTVVRWAAMPASLHIDERLPLIARAVGGLLYAKVEPGQMAVRLTVPQLRELTGLGRTAVLGALADLESSRWIFRLKSGDHRALDHLLSIGYVSPWAGPSAVQPRQALVLNACLPDPSRFRLDGTPADTINGPPADTIRIFDAGRDRRPGGGSARRRGGR